MPAHPGIPGKGPLNGYFDDDDDDGPQEGQHLTQTVVIAV